MPKTLQSPLKTKTAFLLVVDWGDNRVSADLYFSSQDAFYNCPGQGFVLPVQLVPVQVPLGFEDWDYIPAEY